MRKRMDWRAVRFDWNRARAFLVTAEEGSFSAAARALQIAQPTVGRQVAGLEAELGVALFERGGAGLELTGAGLELLEHARAMGAAATRVSLAATGQSQSAEGLVTITASELISAYLLPPILHDLRLAHPGIELEIVASNDARDLSRREADVAVRNFRPTQPDLVATNLGARAAGLYATPGYLARVGPIASVADLRRAEILGFDHGARMIEGFRALMGAELTQDNFPIVSANHLAQWAMCRAGLGICAVMTEVGDAEPAVRRVLPEAPPLPVPMWLTTHREVRTSRRLRVVFDALVAGLR